MLVKFTFIYHIYSPKVEKLFSTTMTTLINLLLTQNFECKYLQTYEDILVTIESTL